MKKTRLLFFGIMILIFGFTFTACGEIGDTASLILFGSIDTYRVYTFNVISPDFTAIQATLNTAPPDVPDTSLGFPYELTEYFYASFIIKIDGALKKQDSGLTIGEIRMYLTSDHGFSDPLLEQMIQHTIYNRNLLFLHSASQEVTYIEKE